MNKIYRVLNIENQKTLAVGYLIFEDDRSFKMRVQNGIETSLQLFEKDKFRLKSIYEQGSEEMYQIITKNDNNKDVSIELPKYCFGGCG